MPPQLERSRPNRFPWRNDDGPKKRSMNSNPLRLQTNSVCHANNDFSGRTRCERPQTQEGLSIKLRQCQILRCQPIKTSTTNYIKISTTTGYIHSQKCPTPQRPPSSTSKLTHLYTRLLHPFRNRQHPRAAPFRRDRLRKINPGPTIPPQRTMVHRSDSSHAAATHGSHQSRATSRR